MNIEYQIYNLVLDDLMDRSGFDDFYYSIDMIIRDEMRETISSKIRNLLEKSP